MRTAKAPQPIYQVTMQQQLTFAAFDDESKEKLDKLINKPFTPVLVKDVEQVPHHIVDFFLSAPVVKIVRLHKYHYTLCLTWGHQVIAEGVCPFTITNIENALKTFLTHSDFEVDREKLANTPSKLEFYDIL